MIDHTPGSLLHCKFTYGQKNGVISLTSSHIVIRFSVSASSHVIPLEEVLGLRLISEPCASSDSQHGTCGVSTGEVPKYDKCRTLRLWPFLTPGKETSSSLDSSSAVDSKLSTPDLKCTRLDVYYAAKKDCSQWVVSRLSLCHPSLSVVGQWESEIKERLSAFTQRPTRVLVFINPYGGKRQAGKIYQRHVAPIFRIADMQVDVIETERRNHAFDFLATNNIETYSAVVGVGGDGLVSELINGMAARLNHEEEDMVEPKLPVPLGVIPAGSTNTLDFSLNGRSFPLNAAINIALGRRLKMDVMGIFQEDKLVKLCFNGVFYGFLGDTMQRSEKLRFLGPPRYNVSGVQTFLGDSSKVLHCEYRGSEEGSEGSSGKTSPKCRRQCSKCEVGLENDCSGAGGDREWESISGKFHQVGGMVHSMFSRYSPKGLSPGAHIGDGYLDVICVKGSSKIDFLRFLIMTRFSPEKKFDLPFVTLLRVKEFRITPKAGSTDFYNCDGELLSATPIHCRAFRQMLEVFSHGNDADPPVGSSLFGNDTTWKPESTQSGFFSKLCSAFRKRNKGDSASSPNIDLLFSHRKPQQEFVNLDRERSKELTYL